MENNNDRNLYRYKLRKIIMVILDNNNGNSISN